MAILEIEGQEIPIENEFAQTDEQIKAVLSSFYPGISNGRFERITKDGELRIKIIKRAGSNGSPFDNLVKAPVGINPAISLAWRIREKQLSGSKFTLYCVKHCRIIEKSIELGNIWNRQTEQSIDQLKRAKAIASREAVAGV